MDAWYPSYNELEDYYKANFSMYYFNTTLENKLVMIGLICYLTDAIRKKNPDTTTYQVIMQILKDRTLDEHIMASVRALSVICADYMNGYNGPYSDFGLKPKEMAQKIREIFDTWVPF